MPIILTLDDTLATVLEVNAQLVGETSEALAQRLLRDRLLDSKVIEHDMFQRNLAAFNHMLPELLQTHAGKAVAFLNGELVGVGADRITLAQEIWARYGYTEILVREVALTPPVHFLPYPYRERQNFPDVPIP
ncbi:MAG: hypothetical protein MI924_25455 [Chloroflexales bacterium]|nr:hypothetical protein [Chloroflexales bacterium]